MKIRKQVYELTPADLTDHPIWEFALHEEHDEGQDEATVRPWNGAVPLNPKDGMFVVRATFVLADGTRHLGYVTPPVHGDTSPASIQPVIVSDGGQVMFWCGVEAPTPDFFLDAYRKLDRTAEQVFPIRYICDVAVVGDLPPGLLAGFMHFRSLRDRAIVEVTG